MNLLQYTPLFSIRLCYLFHRNYMKDFNVMEVLLKHFSRTLTAPSVAWSDDDVSVGSLVAAFVQLDDEIFGPCGDGRRGLDAGAAAPGCRWSWERGAFAGCRACTRNSSSQRIQLAPNLSTPCSAFSCSSGRACWSN